MKSILTLVVGCHLILGQVVNLVAKEVKVADDEKREAIATVLGKPIYLDQITPAEASENRKKMSRADYKEWLLKSRTETLFTRISGAILKEYAIREKLSPSDDEIDAFIAAAAGPIAEKVKHDEDAKKELGMQVFWLTGSSRDWRTAKALHEKYGGRVAVSSFGACTSVEGRNAVLKAFAEDGELTFKNATLEKAFWEKTKDKRVLDVTLQPDSVEEYFAVPPWEQWLQERAKKDAAAK